MLTRARAFLLTSACALAATATTALAQTQTPATMEAVTFPLSLTSVVTEIGKAGAVVLGLTFGIVIAFRFVKKLMRRATSAV